MTATYPAQVKQFVAHRNSVEDIDASHVNSLQDEASAIETVLGTYPHIDATLNNIYNNYGTVRGRMEQLGRGTNIPAVSVSRVISKQSVANNTSTNIVWDTSSQVDPYNMFSSGTDIVLNKQGIWLAVGGAAFDNHNDSNVRAVILNWANMKGTNTNAVSSWGFLTGFNTNWDVTTFSNLGIATAYNVVWAGKLPKGAIIRILVQQQSGVTLGVIANLCLICLREI